MNIKRLVLKCVYPFTVFFSRTGKKGQMVVNNKRVKPLTSFYNLHATKNDGEELHFSELKGKKVLIVNTASDCGYTPQYEELEQLYRQFSPQLIILGFPSNDFGEQEKGSDEEIVKFCNLHYHISFPLMKKSSVVKGFNQNNVYNWLCSKVANGWNDMAPEWNFYKYLVDETGILTHIFGSAVAPTDKTVVNAVIKNSQNTF